MLGHKEVDEKQSLTSLTKEIESTVEYEIEAAKYLISDLIYSIMEQEGISRADLAKLMNRSRPFITKLLSGNNNFEISTLVHVSRACGYKLNVENLFIPRESKSSTRKTSDQFWAFENSPFFEKEVLTSKSGKNIYHMDDYSHINYYEREAV